jgi:hypothetical protein
MAAGLMGILVQTGKYRPGQETRLTKPPTLVAKNLKAAVDLLIGFGPRRSCVETAKLCEYPRDPPSIKTIHRIRET